MTQTVPTDCWYALAASGDVDRSLLAVRAVDRPVLLFRAMSGDVVALEDRCAHRAYPLSAGVLDGDTVRCGLCGFGYDRDGQCISVPTQPRVPLGAHVAAYPTVESDGLVWVWLGEPGRARLHRVLELPWLTGDGWATVGGSAEVAAGFLVLHESFADVTQVPHVAPDLAPAVLGSTPPPLDVVVTETTVTLRREFAPAPLPEWQSRLVGLPADAPVEHVQEGYFLSPAAWVDHWDVRTGDDTWARLRFTQLVTPLAPGRSRVLWRVSRDFAIDDPAATGELAHLFGSYYARVLAAMETAQAVLDTDGPGPEVNVSADVAALKVREIVGEMLAEEGAVAPWQRGRRFR